MTDRTHPLGLLLSTLAAKPADRRLALSAVAVSLAVFVALAPFAQTQLAAVWAFIPAYETAVIVTDLITAVLLLGQYYTSRARSLLWLTLGYLFTAFIAVMHGLSFPGLFAADGLLGAGVQSTAWLYMFWHGGFPLFVIGYARSRNPGQEPPAAQGSFAKAVSLVFVAAVGLAGLCTALATLGHDLLPVVMRGSHYASGMARVIGTVWASSLLAALVLWRRRPHSVLDLWLMVVMCSWSFDIALSAMLNGGRFDLGFYGGRIFGLLASSFVLLMLLLENGQLYANLVRAHLLERQRALDTERLSTQLEQVNTLLTVRNEQLEQSSRMKSEFLSNMSHELRTPLNAIIGFSEMMKDGLAGEMAPNQLTYVSHVFQSGQHLLALINDILDLSKIEAGKVEIHVEALDLDALLSESLAVVAERARTKQIRLKRETEQPTGTVHADRRRVRQIIDNLLSNALKFTPSGGMITLRTRLVDRVAAAATLPGYKQGVRIPLPDNEFRDFIEIAVIDTGIGLGPQDAAKLFRPFTQIDNQITRSAEGTGLGLAMVRRLTELHGGTVSVTSEPGSGSCFAVWLPLRVDADKAAAREILHPSAHGPLALVIEDDTKAATLMRVQLEAEGFRVRHAPSAEAALKLVDEFVPAIITLDVMLPGMDGWDFLALLKDVPQWEDVPVVVVSVVADQGLGFSLGASLVLQKPVSRDALAKGLNRLGLVPDSARDVTVLVIDDDPSAVEILASFLHQSGYIVLCAFGGKEGIELAQRFKPDLITLDLEMPEVSGFDVVEALKAEPQTTNIPIVVVTSKQLSGNDRHRLNQHILEIVDKAEFNHGHFINEVQRALSRPMPLDPQATQLELRSAQSLQ